MGLQQEMVYGLKYVVHLVLEVLWSDLSHRQPDPGLFPVIGSVIMYSSILQDTITYHSSLLGTVADNILSKPIGELQALLAP